MNCAKKSWLLVRVLCLCFSLDVVCAQDGSWEESMAAGMQAFDEGRYAEATRLFLVALKEAEKFGEQDPRFAASLNNLGLLYQAQGQYAQAEPLYERALAIAEKALGPEHPNVATSLENYAALLHKFNRDAEADKMEARAQAIRAKHAKENPPK